MPYSPSVDPIDYLVRRKFPRLFPKFPGSIATQNHRGSRAPTANTLRELEQLHEEAKRYREELNTKSPEEIASLCAEEKQLERQQLRERVEAEERKLFFNQPILPDYEHYCRCATWTLEEAVALSFGKDPNRVSSSVVQPYASYSPFARQYINRWIEAQRAKSAGQLWDPVLPGIFIPWARNLGIELPKELLSRAVNRGISLKGWQNLYDEAIEGRDMAAKRYEDTIAKLKHRCQELLDANQKLRQPAEQHESSEDVELDESLTPATRNSLLKLVIVMAVQGYRFDPRAGRNVATADIVSDSALLGMSMTGETVLKYLRMAAEFLPKGALAAAKRKPKSPKSKPKSD